MVNVSFKSHLAPNFCIETKKKVFLQRLVEMGGNFFYCRPTEFNDTSILRKQSKYGWANSKKKSVTDNYVIFYIGL